MNLSPAIDAPVAASKPPPKPAAAAKPHPLELLASHLDSSLGLQRQLRLPRAVVYAIGGLSIALGVWMSLAKVDRVVHTQGRAIPSGKQQLVQHFEGGIVSKVYVHEGDHVSVGESLVAVSDLQATSTRGERRARLNGLLARAARLQAEAEGASRFSAPAGLPADSAELRSETDSFQARQARLAQSVRIISEQLVQKRQEAAEQEVRYKGLNTELETARKLLALVTNMLARNAGSQLELLDAQSKVERLSTQIREAEAAVPRLKSAVLELQARLSETEAQFRSEARTTLADTRVELKRLQQELSADDDRVVVSPVSGRVNKLLFNTVGGVVKPGDTLLELTPDDASLVVETRVAPQERGALQVGQKTIVKVAAFDYTVFGTLSGSVSEISPDSLADERGERYFRVSIAVDPQSYQAFGQSVTPGMTVVADAVTGQRTILQYLLSPIRGITSTAFRDRK